MNIYYEDTGAKGPNKIASTISDTVKPRTVVIGAFTYEHVSTEGDGTWVYRKLGLHLAKERKNAFRLP